MTAKKSGAELTAEERHRKNRRFNRMLYFIASVLILAGIIIIVSDQTFFFKNVEQKIEQVVSGETPPIMPTLPPLPMHTYDPSKTLAPREDDPWNTALPSEEPTEFPTQTASQTQSDNGTSEGNQTPKPTSASVTAKPTNAPTPQPTEIPYNPFAPKCVYFVDHNISCPVDPVGYNDAGQMAVVRSAFRAGWFKFGGDPVHGGNILIAGHNRYSGKLGYFSIIKTKLKVGEIVIVEMQNGEYAYFTVDSITEYPYDAVPDEVMSTGGTPRLTLITCLGDYSSALHTSKHRVIAVCSQVYFG